jgi:N-acetylneuraminic acid mutarotase
MAASTLNGKIYLMGGCDGAQDCDTSAGFCACTSLTHDVQVYDPDADAYTAAAPMPRRRYRHVSCVWRDAVYVFGGRSIPDDAMITAVDVFNTTSGEWATLPGSADYPAQLGSDNACFTVGDAIYMAGGYAPDYSVSTDVTFAFSPLTNTWAPKAGRMLQGRGDFSAASVGGKGHIYGGYTAADFCNPIDTHEEYDPVADAWTTRAPLPATLAEKDTGVVLLGRVFSVGGERKSQPAGCSDLDIIPVRDVYSYDLLTDTWRNETFMPEPRMRFAAAPVDSILFVFGGQGPLVDGDALPLKYTAFAFSYENPGSTANSTPTFGLGVVVGAVFAVFGGTLAIVGAVVYYCCFRRVAANSSKAAAIAASGAKAEAAYLRTEEAALAPAAVATLTTPAASRRPSVRVAEAVAV